MRCQFSLAVACFVVSYGAAQAQERVPLPQPDPLPSLEPSMPNPASRAPSAPGKLGDSSAPISPGTYVPGSPSLGAPMSDLPSPIVIPKPLSNLQVPAPAQYSPQPYPPYAPSPYDPPPYARRVPLGDPVGNPQVWFGIEGLAWWSKNQPLPVPLITTGPASQGSFAGNLGVSGTTSLNGPLNYGAQSGMRIYGGAWFDPSNRLGVDGSLFFLGQQSAGFGAYDRSGSGNFVINEPLSGSPPFTTQVSAPGLETGSVQVRSSSRFSGGDVNARYSLFRDSGLSLALVGGFRYLQLDESIDIASNSSLFTTTTYTDNFNNVLATAPPGSSVLVVDQFGTRNQFYGGQIGAQVQYTSNRWYFGGTGKLALGTTHESVNVNGYTNVFPVNGPPVPLTGGNYATLQTGQYSTNHFAVAPEVQLNLGYQFTPFMRGLIGYNFIYLSSVARPGNQIDNSFDGVTHPLVPMTSSSFWTQGINFSLQISY